MPKSLDFLKPDIEQIRHQIICILDSYSHEWDILSELAQNSVDAIRASDVDKGRIAITIDASTRRIVFRDNGIGIAPGNIQRLLRPFGTNKTGQAKLIGEKGVGLKFVIFSSSKFALRTLSSEGGCTAKIENAAGWALSNSDAQLKLLIDDAGLDIKGTEVELTIASQADLFDYSFEELVFLLRTKTALGDTGFIWDKPFSADVSFTHIDKSGAQKSQTFDCRYLLPTEHLKGQGIEDLDNFLTWMKAGNRSDQEKRLKLLDKVVFTKGKRTSNGRDIRYWSCFVPSRETWVELSESVGILPPSSDPTGAEVYKPGVAFSGGLQTSTKGMPTGISVELKARGTAGYLPNFFFLVDDPALSFDIGRKAIHGRQQGLLRDIAHEKFRDFVNNVRKFVGGGVDLQEAAWDREETFAQIDQLPDLSSTHTRFAKRPFAQEASIAAMFYEMLGQGNFKDVVPLISGYKKRYDLYAKWKGHRAVIEFKFDLGGLFGDFDDDVKLFNDIQVVVLWEVTESDRILAASRGIGIEDVQQSPLKSSIAFPNASYRLTLGPVTPMFVVEMKQMVDSQ